MFFVSVFISEAFATDVAGEGQGARVAHPMCPQRALCHEAFSTELAGVRLPATLVVRLDVRCQPPGAGKLAATQLAMQPLVLVPLQMFGQAMLEMKHL